MQNLDQLKQDFEQQNAWGLYASVDIKNCNPDTIRDAEKIKQFVLELCDLIEMKRFGETTVVNFGEEERVAGFSMTQLIETSLISGHFANATNAAYLDIFSCKFYDPYKAGEFAKEFFEASDVVVQTNLRV